MAREATLVRVTQAEPYEGPKRPVSRECRRWAVSVAVIVSLPIAALVETAPAAAAGSSCRDTQVVTPSDGGGGIWSSVGHGSCGPGSAATTPESSASSCMYQLISTVPTWVGEMAGVLPGDPLPRADTSVWYEQSCPGGHRALIAVPIGSGLVDGAVVTPEGLAVWARNHMRLPRPAVSFSPRMPSSLGPATVVGLPTWWWVSNWSARTQHTQAGSVWVDLTATPVGLTVRPGDGRPVTTCDGPGLPWTPEVSRADPRACTSLYGRSSAAQPGRRFTATLTAVWRVSWIGSGGTGGTLPDLAVSSSVDIPVLEVQAVVTGGGQ